MGLVTKISTIGFSVGAIAICMVAYRHIKRWRKASKVPKETWKHIGALKKICLYPIKSSSAVEVVEADCDSFGLYKFRFCDRRLVLIHEVENRIASVGRYPRMLSIRIKITSPESLELTAPHVDPLALNLSDFTTHCGERFIKQLEGYSLDLIEGPTDHHIWFSRVILNRTHGMRVYLALDPIVETSWWRDIPNDLMPVMVMHDKSIMELNSMLAEHNQVHYQQFRGNLLIESNGDTEPFDEDKWMWLKIGADDNTATILRFNSPCLRCIIPNIDVVSCKRNEDFEPLRTLKETRLRGHPTDPEMGIYFDVYKEGAVKCDDPVYVQYREN